MTVTWREDEPRLTADDLTGAALPLTQWGHRGYSPAAVDGLLNRAAAELVMCVNEITMHRKEIQRLQLRFIESQRGDPETWLADAGEAHAMAVAIVSEAQKTADGYVAGAQEYSARLTEDARRRREVMLAEAEGVLADAQAQARDAANAAMDEPVPDETAGPLRAARAEAAWIDVFTSVYLTHIRAVLAAEIKVIDEGIQRREHRVPAVEAAR